MKRYLFAAGVLLIALSALAQDLTLEDFERPRRLVYFYETEPGAMSEYDEFLLYNSILTDVASANPEVVLVESLNREVPVELAGKEDLARDVDADAWMHVYVAGGLDDLTVLVSLYDMTLGEELDSLVVEPGYPVSYRTLARGFWDELSQSVAERYEPIVEATEATFVGLPGTVIGNLPIGDVEIDDSGETTILLPTPATYVVSADLTGFVPVEETFYLNVDPARVELVQSPTYRFAVDTFLSSFQFPGARFRYNIVPGQWFARLGFDTEVVGVNLVPNRPLFLEPLQSKLSTIYLDGGTLLGSLDSFIRYQLALGGFLRIRHQPLGFETDASLGGIHASAGLEIALWPRQRLLRFVRLFAEYQPALLFTEDSTEWFNRSFTWNSFPSGTAPLMYGLGWAVADLRDLHLGVRIAW